MSGEIPRTSESDCLVIGESPLTSQSDSSVIGRSPLRSKYNLPVILAVKVAFERSTGRGRRALLRQVAQNLLTAGEVFFKHPD